MSLQPLVRIPPLVSAARSAPLIAGRGDVSYRELPCRSALNRCTSERVPFQWTINPYRGCEFACRYCYARYTHEYMGIEEGRLFETEIYAKTGAAAALERDLPAGRVRRGAIAIGTVTDPYQPAERKLKITRSLLEVFARRSGLTLSITTKGTLITRDIDLLREIAARNALSVNVTITTLSRKLARQLEPRAPR
ncbi:MAG TPA: radical SAM protein, partial [Candidatus Saccharimonadales bacterium]|nr:radical SAM protein [Candidatus Saccharimonadales bacterium]